MPTNDIASILGVSDFLDNSQPKFSVPQILPEKTEYSGYYQNFYTTFLTEVNSLPINSLWIINIFDIPVGIIEKYVFTYEGWSSAMAKSYERSRLVSVSSKGILIAQGVKVVGESIDVSREGIKNTGYIQGLVGNGRTPFPVLNISFMENTFSFVDYCLRPWCIAVAHESLKNSNLKKDITITYFGKRGANLELATRKSITYCGCCPINIDEEESNYSGSDVYRLRQVQFAYNRYYMEPIEDALLDLVGGKKKFNGNINGLKLGGVEKITKYVTDLAKTTVQDIVGNTTDSIDTKINKAVFGLKNSIENSTQRLVNKIDDSVNNAIGNTIHTSQRDNVHPIRGSISQFVDKSVATAKNAGVKYIQKPNSSNDSPVFVQNIEEGLRGKPAAVNVNKEINTNDVPDNAQPAPNFSNKTTSNPNADTFMTGDTLKYNLIKPNPPVNDVRHGEINTEHVVKRINGRDYISGLQIDNSGKSINQNDSIISIATTQDDKQVNQDDVVNGGNIPFIIKTINTDDAL